MTCSIDILPWEKHEEVHRARDKAGEDEKREWSVRVKVQDRWVGRNDAERGGSGMVSCCGRTVTDDSHAAADHCDSYSK